MQIRGTYEKAIFKDEGTGLTGFRLKTDKGDLYCTGKVCDYIVGTPLLLEGEEEKGKIRIKNCKISSDHFPSDMFSCIKGIGKEKLKVLEECMGNDVFSFAKRGDAFDILKGKIGEKEARAVLQKIESSKKMEEVFSFIESFGGDYACASKIFKKYGKEALKKTREDPYSLEGLPFYVKDRIGRAVGIKKNAKERLSALLRAVFEDIESNGNTCADLAMIKRYARRYDRDIDPFMLCGQLLLEDKRYKIEETKDGVRAYRKNTYDNERIATDNIKRLLKTSKKLPIDEVDIGKIEEECGVSYDESQRRAFELLKTSGIKILTGGPGTGKTATMNGIVRAFKEMIPGARISLCSPTANAAKRLSEATGEKALTIHKLLGLRPFGDRLEAETDLNANLVIADEASMIDLEIFSLLIRAMENGSTLLLVGDEDQLPSVGCGNILHDLLECEKIEKVRLSVIHRQDGDCSIVSNSLNIKEGIKEIREDEHTEVYRVKDEEELSDLAMQIAFEQYDPDDPQRARVFTPVRKERYAFSTKALNERFHDLYHKKDDAVLIRGGQSFSKGDPIVMTRNNYETGYLNGEEGIVEAVMEEGGSLLVKIEDKTLEIKGDDLSDIDLAYALTVHKAQGSECETAVIVIPEEPKSMLTRNLLYVAATRAKKKNIFIVQGKALDTAIENKREIKRLTGLKEKIG